MPLIRLLLFSALLFPTQAFSACTYTGQTDLKQFLDHSSEAIERDDLIDHGATVRNIKEALPCLNGQLQAVDWASFLVGLSTVEFATGGEWRSLLNTAYRIDPNLHIDYGAPEFRQHLPKKSVSEMRTVAANGRYFLDGIPLTEVGKLNGLHIGQRSMDGDWETRVLENDPFPEEWLAPKPVATPSSAEAAVETKPQKKGVGLLIAGGAMTVAGTAGGVGSYITLTNTQYPTKKQASTMTAVNVASWSVAITGIGLGVVGILATPQTSGPVRLGFSGNGIQLNGVLP